MRGGSSQKARASGLGVRAKIEIEEEIVAKMEVPAGRTQRLLERHDRVQGERQPTGTDQERRHRHVQAIERTSL